MKVVCINSEWSIILDTNDSPHQLPQKNEIYTVIDYLIYGGYTCYKFKELKGYYEKSSFIPLDEYLDQYTESLKKELTEVEQLELV